LETQGAVLDKIKIVKTKVKVDTKTSTKDKTTSYKTTKTQISTNNFKGFDMNIFSKTVHTELKSSYIDVKAVQTIYKDLGYYK
jgi:hypothetical protein